MEPHEWPFDAHVELMFDQWFDHWLTLGPTSTLNYTRIFVSEPSVYYPINNMQISKYQDTDGNPIIPMDDIQVGASAKVCMLNGVEYMSIRDLIMSQCEKTNKRASETWATFSPEAKRELSGFCGKFQFPGRGQREEDVINFQGAMRLIMMLTGDVAMRNRSKMVDKLQRFYAGDRSLIQEIEGNAESNSDVCRMARASLLTESPETLLERKRKRELEETDLHAKKLGNVTLFTSTMSLINPNWRDDTRLRLQTEDWLKNVAFNSGVFAITNGETVQANKSVSVTQVAKELGYNLNHANQIKVGRLVAAKYRAKYDAEPPTHAQWVDGAERMVKSYTEADRKLIVEALAEPGFGSQD